MTRAAPKYATEAALCAAFIEYARAAGWVVYPETAGFDLLLVRPEGDAHAGVQLGIQAKLTLNAKVAAQILPYVSAYGGGDDGPDFHAVLVGSIGGATGIAELLHRCGVATIAPASAYSYAYGFAWPLQPGAEAQQHWQTYGDSDTVWSDWNPAKRCALPSMVPTVAAGVPCPVQLTPWKINALRVLATLARDGSITPSQIKKIGCDPSRWCRSGDAWLDPCGPGLYARSSRIPNLEAQHPLEYARIVEELEPGRLVP